MPLIGYKKEFAPLVESGEKRQTIRAMRKRPFKKGDRLYHYFGLRTKNCRKLLECDCIAVDEISISAAGNVKVNSRPLTRSQVRILAYRDGFRPYSEAREEFIAFFRKNHSLPFNGQLIKWSAP